MEFGPVYDGLVPLQYPYEVVGVDSGGNIVDYGLDVSFSSDLVMPVRASWLMATVVALVEDSALFGQEGLEAVGPYYRPGSCAEF